MPRTIAVRMKCIFWVLLLVGLVPYSFSTDRHMLIIANEDEGYNLRILKLLSTGEIITTGQSFSRAFSGDKDIGVSPDQRFFWSGDTLENRSSCFRQYAISHYGTVTETGRFIELGIGMPISSIKFTPNGQLLLMYDPIYRAYPDGSVESTGNTYSGTLYLSPRGDINIRVGGNDFYVDRIDYDTFSINSIQHIVPDGGSAGVFDVTYTPEGDYVAMTNRGGSSADVEVYPVLTDGSLDTTKVQRFDMGSNANPITSSKDGKYIYVGYDDQLHIAILRRVYTGNGSFEDTGWRTYTGYWPWQLAVSPDGKYLVANNHNILESFTIQDDGNLVSKFKFPFSTTFGKGPYYFQFAYPPAPTEVAPADWQLYQ